MIYSLSLSYTHTYTHMRGYTSSKNDLENYRLLFHQRNPSDWNMGGGEKDISHDTNEYVNELTHICVVKYCTGAESSLSYNTITTTNNNNNNRDDG